MKIQRTPENEKAIFDLLERLFERLRVAGYAYSHLPGRSAEGALIACSACAEFLENLGCPAELGAPLLGIAAAFDDLKKGITPPLFSKLGERQVRSRSRQRKHAQMWAAICLEEAASKGKPLIEAGAKVARLVTKWDEFKNLGVTGQTIIVWRKSLKAKRHASHTQFAECISKLQSEGRFHTYCAEVLRKGPPGAPKAG